MARTFDGAVSVLGIPITSVLRPPLPVTVSAWIRADTYPAGAGIFTSNKTDATHRGFTLSIADTSGHVATQIGDNTGVGPTERRSKISDGIVPIDVWSHVTACMRGATDMDIYIDGKEAGGAYSGSGGAMGYNTGISGRIGMQGGTAFFDGDIAEVAIWNVSLTSNEVMQLAQGTLPNQIRQGALLAFWPLDSHNGLDRSKNRNDITSITGTVNVVSDPILAELFVMLAAYSELVPPTVPRGGQFILSGIPVQC